MILDPEKFRAFEHRGWEEIPAGYDAAFGSLTTQTVEPLLDAARVKKGMKVLDIASGPGYVAASAAKRGATVAGIDFSAAMVAQAQKLHPGIDFREGDAESLPFGNGLFDAAVMNFGILHLGQPHRALTEAYRGASKWRSIGILGVVQARGNHWFSYRVARCRAIWRAAY